MSNITDQIATDIIGKQENLILRCTEEYAFGESHERVKRRLTYKNSDRINPNGSESRIFDVLLDGAPLCRLTAIIRFGENGDCAIAYEEVWLH